MTEFIVRVSAVILLGLEVLLFALLFAARSVKALRTIEWSLCANSVLVLLFFAYFAWVFRDPWSIFGGTRPSEGAVALFRFAQGIWRLLLTRCWQRTIPRARAWSGSLWQCTQRTEE